MTKSELIKEECKINNCNFLNIDYTYPCFFTKLSELLELKKHEQKIIHSGIIFSKSFSSNLKYKKQNKIYQYTTDGEKIFELIDENCISSCIVFYENLSPYDLVKLTQENSDTVIIVKSEMNILIYSKGLIYIIEDRIWNIRQNVGLIPKKLKYIFPSLDVKAFTEILEYAAYELSIRKIGTTIVYNTTIKMPYKDISKKKDCNLKIIDRHNRIILTNYLNYHDGAILVNHNNIVQYTDAILSSKPPKTSTYSSTGTRHTSAYNFSYRNPNTIVITVSEDGPISVFVRGNELSNLSISIGSSFSIDIKSYEKMARDIDEICDSGYDSISCPNCKTQYEVQYMKMTGNNNREELDCDICGETFYHKSCFILDKRITAIHG